MTVDLSSAAPIDPTDARFAPMLRHGPEQAPRLGGTPKPVGLDGDVTLTGGCLFAPSLPFQHKLAP